MLTTTNRPNAKIMNFPINPNIEHKLLHSTFKKKNGKVIENKEVVRATLNKDREIILKSMKFDSKKVQKTRALYKEYRVGYLLGSLTDGVAKSIGIKEIIEGSDTTVGIAYKDVWWRYSWSMRESL